VIVDPEKIGRRASGFSLLEILLVLALIAGGMAILLNRQTSPDYQIQTALQDLRVVLREVFHAARMTQTTHRLVLQMQGEDDGNARYWVERATRQGLVLSSRTESLREEKDKDAESEQRQEDFVVDTKVVRKPRSLPSKLRLESVEVGADAQRITSGKVYVYFRPEGLVDAAALHVVGSGEARWTISVHPLTGRADMVQKDISLKDLYKSR
jgi:general secretion pathway protein H